MSNLTNCLILVLRGSQIAVRFLKLYRVYELELSLFYNVHKTHSEASGLETLTSCTVAVGSELGDYSIMLGT